MHVGCVCVFPSPACGSGIALILGLDVGGRELGTSVSPPLSVPATHGNTHIRKQLASPRNTPVYYGVVWLFKCKLWTQCGSLAAEPLTALTQVIVRDCLLSIKNYIVK